MIDNKRHRVVRRGTLFFVQYYSVDGSWKDVGTGFTRKHEAISNAKRLSSPNEVVWDSAKDIKGNNDG